MALKSYFDGSNHADSSEYDRISIAVVGGTREQWRRFDRAWREVLDKHRADYLHTTDAVSLRNDFAKEDGWNNARVDSFIGDCVTVVGQHIAIPPPVLGLPPKMGLFTATVTVPFDDWLRAKKTVPELPDTIEEICATESLGFALKWGKYIGSKKWQLYYDRGEPFYGHIRSRWLHPRAQRDIELMKDVLNVDESIARYVPALQMADLLAWSINRANQETRLWHIRLHDLRCHNALLDYKHLINPSRQRLAQVASWGLPRRQSSVKNLSKPKRVVG